MDPNEPPEHFEEPQQPEPPAPPPAPSREHDEAWQVRLYLKLVVLLGAIAYAVAFVLENRTKTSIHFVFHTAHISLVWMILLNLAIGLLGGVLLSQLYRRRRRRGQKRGKAADAGLDLDGRDEAVGKPG